MSAEVFELGPYRLQVANEFGPRVLGFRLDEGPEMFTSLGPEVVIDRPDSGVYRFRGGHRLWASPELPTVTYAPDDQPCQVTRDDGEVTIEGPVDRAGLAKTIRLGGGPGGIMADHVLTNGGDNAIQVAPWALTQLRLGGTAIFPLRGETDEIGLSASSSLVLWPYTDLTDPRISWLGQGLAIRADPGPPFKVGTGPTPGRLGYLLDGHLFTKQVRPDDGGSYPDRGAVGQFYLGDTFCELESLGPQTVLEPGDRITHREVWEIEECADLETAVIRVMGAS